MIIFEGTDCTGKTTVCLDLVHFMARRELLTGFRRYGLLPEWWDYCNHYLNDVKRNMVLDRFTASEAVYGALFRGSINQKFTDLKQAVVARELQRQCALTVLMRPPLDIMLGWLEKRGPDKLFKKDQIIQAYHSFDEIIGTEEGRSKWDNTSLMIFGDSYMRPPGGCREDILEAVELLWEAYGWYDELGTDGHGPTHGGTQAVFLGESLNLTYEENQFLRAFCCGPAAEYLHELILSVGLDPKKCHMVNAIQRDGRPLDPKALQWAVPPRRIPIVALGGVAQQWCEKNGFKCLPFQHPAYLKRFRSKDTEAVSAELNQLLKEWRDAGKENSPKPS